MFYLASLTVVNKTMLLRKILVFQLLELDWVINLCVAQSVQVIECPDGAVRMGQLL